jgi:hypothetical protein
MLLEMYVFKFAAFDSVKRSPFEETSVFLNGMDCSPFFSKNINIYTTYFTNDNEPGGIENATHNTFERKPGHGGDKYPAFPVLWVAFSIPPGSLSLVKYPV